MKNKERQENRTVVRNRGAFFGSPFETEKEIIFPETPFENILNLSHKKVVKRPFDWLCMK